MQLILILLMFCPLCLSQESRLSVPNGTTLPWVMENGVKVFHLIAEPIEQEFAPGLSVNCWGYNGMTPGPVIEATEGERIRVLVTNRLPESTSVHWHGILLPNGMDGVAGLTQPPIAPGETFQYEFTLKQHGTYMYHPHLDEATQIGMGLMGFLIIHPKAEEGLAIDRDFPLFFHEWHIPAGAKTPDPMVMTDFNYFTINGHVFPGTEALVVQQGERVRIRLANLSMNNHPIHLHGYVFTVTASGGWTLPKGAQYLGNTVDVVVGNTNDVEFTAEYPGDWALHCHKTHHLMNGMGHDLPNMIGVDQTKATEKISKLLPGYMPMGSGGMEEMCHMSHHMERPPNFLPYGSSGPFGMIDMSGMFTILKVRKNLVEGTVPGWYEHPPDTVAKRLETPS